MYAAVNLKRNLRSTSRTIEATDRHEAVRSLSATAELLVMLSQLLLAVLNICCPMVRPVLSTDCNCHNYLNNI